ncbi:MAG: glycosyltransferase family 2 protein [Patescibacteria group bacterium]
MATDAPQSEAFIMKKITLVIVNWNGSADTANCLSSILHMKKQGVALETVVVDNGSTDNSVAKLSAGFPWVTILAVDKNLGFTGGNNTGIRYAMLHGAEYIWLLNNDTIVHPDALKLVGAFADSKVGIAGSKIYFAPGHEYHKARYTKKELGRVFWYAGGLIDWDNMYASHRGVDEVEAGQYDDAQETSFVTGCSMMVKREVIRSVGELDDRYYLYLEDLDFGLRAKAAGYHLVYYPKSVIWHVNAGSSGGAGNPIHDYYITRNRLLVGMRYAPFRTKAALLREAWGLARGGNREKKQAVIDAFWGKWGKQYEPKKNNT